VELKARPGVGVNTAEKANAVFITNDNFGMTGI
jgi:hypothetical protein